MPKIYIDTNVFIDIYQSSTDPVGVIDEITDFASHLVVPEQTINEFHRNRVGVLQELSKNFSKSIEVKPWFSSLIRHLPEFQDLATAAAEFKTIAHRLFQKLEAAKDLANDPVAQKVSELFNNPKATQIPLNDELIAKAHRRKLLGNPPTSPDKYTIGDEVIWEALLAEVRDDLVVVTRDRTFLNHEQILATEFHAVTKRNLLLVTTRVGDAIKRLGAVPPPKLVEEDDRIDEEEKCPKCGASGLLYESGWFECGRCGYFGRSQRLGLEHQIRTDVERYVASTIRLLRGVPQQRPDLVVQREAADKIALIQSRLEHFDEGDREHLAKPLAEAHTATQNGQLGLALAYMERVGEILL